MKRGRVHIRRSQGRHKSVENESGDTKAENIVLLLAVQHTFYSHGKQIGTFFQNNILPKWVVSYAGFSTAGFPHPRTYTAKCTVQISDMQTSKATVQ